MKLPCALLLLPVLAVAGEAEGPATWKPLEHSAFRERVITGFTSPARTVVLAAEVPGRITAVPLEAGQVVPAGEAAERVACRLDDTAAALAVARAEAATAEAVAARTQLEAEVAVAGRDAAFRRSELERLAGLGEGTIPERELDAARYAADAADLRVKALETAVARGAAGQATAAAAVAQARDHRARHVVTAPAGWVVTDRLQEPGATVLPGAPVLRLADVVELAVHLFLDEAEVAALPAEDVPLVFARHPDHRAVARVHQVDVALDPRTFKRRVELRLTGADAPAATGGLEVKLTLSLAEPGAVLVPRAFLDVRMEQPYVVAADGTRLPVTVLRRQDGHVVVAAAAFPAGLELVRPAAVDGDGP